MPVQKNAATAAIRQPAHLSAPMDSSLIIGADAQVRDRSGIR
jgi:hypothetical protein